ncbi:MAG: GntR family transcriptional regulator [Sphingomonadaceae bacterium]
MTWQEITDHIEKDIREHILKPGDRLPTEQELANKYRVGE